MSRDKEKYKEYQRLYQQKSRAQNIKDKKYTRLCPKCTGEIIYGTKQTFNYGIKNKSVCKICTAITNIKIEHDAITSGLKNNGFKNKKHTKETKDKIRNHPNQKNVLAHHNYKTRKIISGKDHHFTGKHHTKNMMEIWTRKYGLVEAEKRLTEYLQKKSIAMSGTNNHMYGKPSPHGSGNGISGWFNNVIFFRSLLELNFLVTCHKLKYTVRSTECKEFQVKYYSIDFYRNYYPDFILNEKYIVECKPERLIHTLNNQAKFKAAVEKWGVEKFKVITPPKFDIHRIPQLIQDGLIKLTDKSENYFRTKRNKDI